MKRRFALHALLLLLSAPTLLAQLVIHSVEPSSGPTTGGTVVTIKGELGAWPYYVYFGGVPAKSTDRADANTLTAVTPAHLPGNAPISVFEYDIMVGTTGSFTFEGDVTEEDFERILVPLLTPPVSGAFGSEFHTDLRLRSKNDQHSLQVFGLPPLCPDTPIPTPICSWDPANDSMNVQPGFDFGPTGYFDYGGRPGLFIYLDNLDALDLAGNLRVHDVSRASLNYGTEIPLVRQREFQLERIVLPGVPGDARFRNTLRIYGTTNMTVTVTVPGKAQAEVVLTGADGLFKPSYGTFTDFPTGIDPFAVRIDGQPPATGPSPPIYFGSFWAFVSVTNNETQVISTITPQP